jgi:hypothetical protein
MGCPRIRIRLAERQTAPFTMYFELGLAGRVSVFNFKKRPGLFYHGHRLRRDVCATRRCATGDAVPSRRLTKS